MTVKFTNNAEAALDAGITAVATTLDVKTGQGSMFPEITGGSGDYFMFSIIDTAGNVEVCKCTSHAAASVTFAVIEREQEDVAGTAAASTGQAFSADDKVELRQTAGVLDTWEASFSTAHTQNTDTGTTSDVFQLESGSSGIKLKNDSGVFAVRNAADGAWAALKATVGTFTGALSAASLVLAGAITGVTNLTASGIVTAEQITSTDDINATDDITAGGKLQGATLTVTGTSTLSTTNVSGKLLARDHGTASVDEVVNVCYGTGSPPTASTTTIGALFIKYVS